MPDPSPHVLAHVFKVTVDPYVGKLGVFRVHQGTVTRTASSTSATAASRSRSAHLFMLQGKDHVEVRRACRATSCAVAKVDEIHFDAVLHDAAEDDHVHLEPLDVPDADVRPGDRAEAARRRAALWEILAKLVDEDPCLKVEHVAAHQRDRSSTASASCTCACCSSGCARRTSFEVDTRPPTHRLSRDDHRAGRGPPPPQEADRRRRPVRRGVPAHRAAAARRAASSSSTRSRAARSPASSSRRSRRASARCCEPARSPATRCATCA